MKHIAALAVAAALAGCAASPSIPAPEYDHSARAVIAPGFPIAQLSAPPGFRMSYDGFENNQRLPRSEGGGSLSERGFVWSSGSGGTAIMSALYRQVAGGSHFLPSPDVDAREEINGNHVAYLTDTGRYFDLVFWRPALPAGAPRCAIGTAVFITAPDHRREVAGDFVEGLPCDSLDTLGADEIDTHRQRALQAFGLR